MKQSLSACTTLWVLSLSFLFIVCEYGTHKGGEVTSFHNLDNGNLDNYVQRVKDSISGILTALSLSLWWLQLKKELTSVSRNASKIINLCKGEYIKENTYIHKRTFILKWGYPHHVTHPQEQQYKHIDTQTSPLSLRISALYRASPTATPHLRLQHRTAMLVSSPSTQVGLPMSLFKHFMFTAFIPLFFHTSIFYVSAPYSVVGTEDVMCTDR